MYMHTYIYLHRHTSLSKEDKSSTQCTENLWSISGCINQESAAFTKNKINNVNNEVCSKFGLHTVAK